MAKKRKTKDRELLWLLDEFEACENARSKSEDEKKTHRSFKNKVLARLKSKGYNLREVKAMLNQY